MMQTYRSTRSLLAALGIAAAVNTANAEPTCQKFTAVTHTYTDRGGNHTTPFLGENPILSRNISYQVAPGETCAPSKYATTGVCSPDYCDPGHATPGVCITVPGWTNFTGPDFAAKATDADRASLKSLYDLVGADVDSAWPLDATFTSDGTEGTALCLGDGNSGFWVFTPSVSCVQGSFSGCSGETDGLVSIKDGEPVEICAPFTRQGHLYGFTQFYFTDEARKLTETNLKPVPISTDGSVGGGVRGDGHATEVQRGCVDQVYGYGEGESVPGGKLCPVSQW